MADLNQCIGFCTVLKSIIPSSAVGTVATDVHHCLSSDYFWACFTDTSISFLELEADVLNFGCSISVACR